MSERRDADDTRAGTVDGERAGAAGRRAIAARDADADDETAVAGATRTPADERREIIVLRIEEGSAQEKEDKSVGIEKKLCFSFFPFSLFASLKNDDGRTRSSKAREN